MRKILVMVCALLVLITLPLMAGINKGTVAGYYSVESSEQYLSNWGGGPSTAVDIESTSVGVMVKGSSFSDPANPFGYSYNLRVGKTLESTVDGSEEDVSDIPPLRWDIGGVYAAFQQDVSYSTFVEAGAGLQFGSESETWDDGTYTYSWEIFSAYVAGYAELNYAVTATTFVSIGAKALLPIGGTVTLSIDDVSAESDIEMSGFALAPYVGISLAY